MRSQHNELPQLAAKLLVDGSARDFASAKRKAAAALGVTSQRELPDNRTLLSALIGYQQLFDLAAVTARNVQLRTAALNAMAFFRDFNPHLVGAVMVGSTLAHSAVTLHLFADETEQLSRFLLDAKIVFRVSGTALRVRRHTTERFTVYDVWFKDIEFKLVVMPLRSLFNPPLNPVDGAPYRRLGPTQLRTLLASARAGAVCDDIDTDILPHRLV